MALIESVQVPLGTRMPDFSLADPKGRTVTSDGAVGEHGLIVAFTCNHCPYAQAVWPRLIDIAEEARARGVNTVAINPNINPAYPDDSPEKMAEAIEERGIQFPYLIDETQETARAFKAQCTPDVYLFNGDRELVYHGRIDDNWKNPAKVTREELKEATRAMVEGQPVPETQHPSMGCSIKWT
ncbi:MAG: thioredoxin family protein [Terriglobia bacterium]